MPYSTRPCTVIDFHTPVICYIIQREYPNNMVYEDIDARSNVGFFDSKAYTNKSDLVLCIGKVNHYRDVVSTTVVDFID